MTIEKRTDWGAPGSLPADGIVVHSDAEARAVIEAAHHERRSVPVLGLLGGDMCRTLGGTGDAARLRTDAATAFTLDLGTALVDGRIHWFLSHLVARRSWWRGRIVAAMNAQWLGDWDLGPRAHPNDGLLDITDGDLGLGDRWKARRRVRTGTHVPHPALRTSRTPAEQFTFDPPLDVWLDGERVGAARTLSVRVEPDAITVVV